MGGSSEKEKALTPKQEAFALAYFETGSAAEAYRRAYDVSDNARDQWLYVEASQLIDHPKIALRLQELREQAEKVSIFTRQQAMKELEEARELAIKTENPSAAVSAVNSKSKLWGLDAPLKFAPTTPDGKQPAPFSAVAIYELPDNGRAKAD